MSADRVAPLRILLSEDNPTDELLIRRQIERAGLQAELTRVVTEEDFLRELERGPDVVLADHSLPDFSADRALDLVRERAPTTPVIVVSGQMGEEAAVSIMQAGAEDYLLKDRLARLAPAIRAAVERRALRAEADEQRARVRAVAEQRRRLLLRLARAQEEERRRIAEGIHDDSIQFISASAIRLSTLRRKLDDPKLSTDLARVEETLGLAIERLRRLIFELRPSLLDRSGLAAALREFVDSLGTEQRASEYVIDDRMTHEPPGDIRAALYRLIVEALRNAERHARASRIEVILQQHKGGVAATVRDDGVGFDTDATEQAAGHLGLTTIRERAASLGGSVRISSTAGQGTSVEIWIPEAEELDPEGPA